MNSALLRNARLFGGRFVYQKFIRQAKNAPKESANFLQRIVKANQETDFGRRHAFKSILASADLEIAYKSAVPLSRYDDYRDAIERMTRGEQNVLFAEPLTGFAMTSGTTGASKLVPITRSRQNVAILNAMLITPTAAANAFLKGIPKYKGVCLLSAAGEVSYSEGGIPIGMGSSMGMRRMGGILSHFWCSPPEVFVIKDEFTSWYLHALYGLRYRNTQFIGATFITYILHWLMAMEQNWPRLVQDIERGTLNESLKLPQDVREKLAAPLSPDPQRAAELRTAAAQGFETIVPRVWPRIAYVEAVSTGSLAFYVPALRRYIGDLPIQNSTYSSSEGLIGIELWPKRPGEYIPPVGYAYYEFIPVKDIDEEQPQTGSVGDLTVGESYEVVMTNSAGFYRYRMGDIVKVVSHYHKAPVLNFRYRHCTALDLAAEKTSDAQAYAAINQMAETWFDNGRVDLRDYTATVNRKPLPPHYVFYIELSDENNLPTAKTKLEEGARCLDAALREANRLYEIQRHREMVGQVQLKLLKPDSFEQFQQWLFVRKGEWNRNQLKIPRCLINPDQIAWIEVRVVAASSNQG